MADSLADQPGVFEINDFFGGLNTFAPPNKIGENFLVEAQNVRITEVGTLTRRDGITQVGTLAGAQPTNLYMDLFVAGVDDLRRIFLVTGLTTSGKITSINVLGYRNVFDSSTVAIPSVASNGKYAKSVWYRNSAGSQIIQTHFPASVTVSGNVEVRTTIGASSLTAAVVGDTNTDPPALSPTIGVGVDRLWAPGAGSTSHLLYFSGTGSNKETWNRTTDFVSFHGPEGTEIIAVERLRDNVLVVGTLNEIWLLAVGTSIHLDSQVLLLSKDLGFASSKGITNVGSDILFADGNGDIRSISVERNGSGLVRNLPISLGIKDKTDAVQPDDLDGIQMSYIDGQMFLLLPKSSQNEVYRYNLVNRNWAGPDKFSVRGAFSNAQVTGNPLLLTSTASTFRTVSLSDRDRVTFLLIDDGEGDVESVQIYSLKNDGTSLKDDSVYPIDMVATTKAIDFGKPDSFKVLKWIRFQHVGKSGASGSYSIEVRVDFGQWIMVEPAVVYANKPEVDEVHIPLSDIPRGKLFQFRIKCSDTNTQPEIIRVITKVAIVQSNAF